MYRLFLDDERVPYSPNGELMDAYNYTKNGNYINYDWIVVRTYAEFVSHIEKNGMPLLISFDHDLADFNGSYEKTGYDCVKWLCDYCIENSYKLPNCLYHTQNLIGQMNMKKYIENYKKFYE